jgi:hypothetical protein
MAGVSHGFHCPSGPRAVRASVIHVFAICAQKWLPCRGPAAHDPAGHWCRLASRGRAIALVDAITASSHRYSPLVSHMVLVRRPLRPVRVTGRPPASRRASRRRSSRRSPRSGWSRASRIAISVCLSGPFGLTMKRCADLSASKVSIVSDEGKCVCRNARTRSSWRSSSGGGGVLIGVSTFLVGDVLGRRSRGRRWRRSPLTFRRSLMAIPAFTQ